MLYEKEYKPAGKEEYISCKNCPCFRNFHIAYSCSLRFKILTYKENPISIACKLKNITYSYTSKRKDTVFIPKKKKGK